MTKPVPQDMQDVIEEVSTTTSGRGDLANQYKVLDTIIEDSLKGVAYNSDYKAFDVLPQDPEYIGFNLYLCSQLAETTLASDAVINTITVVVTSATGITVGKAINIVQGTRIFQSLITNVVGTTITLASPLDYAFTASAYVCSGNWNMNQNGSVTPVIFKLQPPSSVKFHVTAISVTMTDDATMDDSKFGSLTALTKGIVARRVDGDIYNYFLITNNAGFYQNGYDTSYPDKVPAGVYSFRARKDLRNTNGTIIALDGSTDDEFQVIVPSDLTALTEFTIQLHGHIVES